MHYVTRAYPSPFKFLFLFFSRTINRADYM